MCLDGSGRTASRVSRKYDKESNGRNSPPTVRDNVTLPIFCLTMERGHDRYSSVLVAYRVVCEGLNAIRRESKLMNQIGSDYSDVLTCVETGSFCLIKMLQDIRKCRDLRTIAQHIYGLTESLGLRLTSTDNIDLVR